MKLLLAAAIASAVCALAATAARADGDPASDVLYFQDVYLPYPRPPQAVGAELTGAVAEANGAGLRLKVAVIATQIDLGSVGSLWGHPAEYARFLGAELPRDYTGLLLIVMPAGYGTYQHNADTSAADRAVAGVKINAASSDDLVHTTTLAVRSLIAALGQQADHTPPSVHALASKARKGRVMLRYTVSDDSGRSSEVVHVYRKGTHPVATLMSPMEAATTGTVDFVRWQVPRKGAKGYRFCVVATDPSLNVSKPSCAPIRVA